MDDLHLYNPEDYTAISNFAVEDEESTEDDDEEMRRRELARNRRPTGNPAALAVDESQDGVWA